MELDALQSIWQHSDQAPKTTTEIKTMMLERTHPVLKRIRRQLIIESIAFAFFLVTYYNFFDGDKKHFHAKCTVDCCHAFCPGA